MSDFKKVVGSLFMAIGGFGIFLLFLEVAFLLELNGIAGILINNEALFEDCMNNIAK
jgi:hypothetical protein